LASEWNDRTISMFNKPNKSDRLLTVWSQLRLYIGHRCSLY
jgi:hypothetical protein